MSHLVIVWLIGYGIVVELIIYSGRESVQPCMVCQK